MSSDQLHFSSKHLKSTFTLPAEVCSFVVKNKSTLEVVNKMMCALGFSQGSIWPYDPYHIICAPRVAFKSSAYIYHNKVELELFANKERWEDIQLLMQLKHIQADQLMDREEKVEISVLAPTEQQRINLEVTSMSEEDKSNELKKWLEIPMLKMEEEEEENSPDLDL